MKTILTETIKTVGKKSARTYLELTLNGYVLLSDILEVKHTCNYVYHEKVNRLFFIVPNENKVIEIIKVTHKRKVIFKNDN